MLKMYNFDYFYGNEAEQYQFYMIPQLLFTDKKFKKISTDAKVLYSLLLDRTGLSFANQDRFTDNDGRTYIYFTRDTVMKMLGCSKDKSAAIFKELDEIGLIERKRQGLGKPDKIYVKHFNRILDKSGEELPENQEVGNTDLQRSEKPTSECRKNRLQEDGKNDTNQTNISQTDVNQTDVNQSVGRSANSGTVSTGTDGQTDRPKEEIEYSKILSEIGFNLDSISFFPESEKDFEYFNEDDRKTNKCSIPYAFKQDKKAMSESLKFLFAYSCYNADEPKERIRLLDTVIYSMSEMATTDIHEYQKERVRYCDVIDKINDVVHTSSLMDWFSSFEQEWEKILSEQKIKNKRAYLKACIWNWLKDYQFDEDCLMLSYSNGYS